MKKTKSIAFSIDGAYWIGSVVYALTDYGLPVKLKIDSVNLVVDDKNHGQVLGYFHAGCRFSSDVLLSEKQVKDEYSEILDIPTFQDYITYEVAKAFNKKKSFVSKYEKTYITPYVKYPKDKKECD